MHMHTYTCMHAYFSLRVPQGPPSLPCLSSAFHSFPLSPLTMKT